MGHIRAVGPVRNAGLGFDSSDEGGGPDPRGADLQGDPLGGIIFSIGTTDSDRHALTQVYRWNT